MISLFSESFGEKSFGESSFEESPLGEKSFGESSFEESPLGEKSFGESQTAFVPLVRPGLPDLIGAFAGCMRLFAVWKIILEETLYGKKDVLLSV